MSEKIIKKKHPLQAVLIKDFIRRPGKQHKKGEVLTVTRELYTKLLDGGYIDNPNKKPEVKKELKNE